MPFDYGSIEDVNGNKYAVIAVPGGGGINLLVTRLDQNGQPVGAANPLFIQGVVTLDTVQFEAIEALLQSIADNTEGGLSEIDPDSFQELIEAWFVENPIQAGSRSGVVVDLTAETYPISADLSDPGVVAGTPASITIVVPVASPGDQLTITMPDQTTSGVIYLAILADGFSGDTPEVLVSGSASISDFASIFGRPFSQAYQCIPSNNAGFSVLWALQRVTAIADDFAAIAGSVPEWIEADTGDATHYVDRDRLYFARTLICTNFGSTPVIATLPTGSRPDSTRTIDCRLISNVGGTPTRVDGYLEIQTDGDVLVASDDTLTGEVHAPVSDQSIRLTSPA